MKFACSECGARIEATERFFGRDVGCPTCGRMIHVPRPEENTGISTKAAANPPAGKDLTPAQPPVEVKPTPTRAPETVEKRPVQPPPVRLPGSITPRGSRAAAKRGGSGFGSLLVFGLMLVAGYVGWSKYHDRKSPPSPVVLAPPAKPPGTSPNIPTPVPGSSLAAPSNSPNLEQTKEVEAVEPPAGPVNPPDLPAALASMPTPVPAMKPTPGPTVALPLAASGQTPAKVAPPQATPGPRQVNYFGSGDLPAEEEDPAANPTPAAPFPTAGPFLPAVFNPPAQTLEILSGKRATLNGAGTLRLTKAVDPLPGSVVNFLSPDAWLLLEKVPAADALANLLPRMWVKGVPAAPGVNVRVVQHGSGCLIVPQEPDFAAMQVFGGSACSGPSLALRCGVKYNAESLGSAKPGIGSFRLKRGYMATLAQEENGTGVSRNYVAQDRDLEIRQLPLEFGGKVQFIRVFPWRWTSKKGVAGGIHQNLKVAWFYNWNISENSRPDLEYVPIRQNRWWPGLNQDWLARGATHLLGFNEPDHKDQSNLSVDDAIHAWPELLGTGLRLGSPAVSDGGLRWLFEFMQKADAARLRVDFVAVHYYRAVGNPNDARGAAAQMYNFLKGIHDRTKRPIWVTEWNNGANWTGHKPNYEQEKAAIAAMVEMLDRTPFVERYAIYNWVEDERNVQRKDGSLTPAGEVYRDEVSPLSYTQAAP